MNNSNLTQSSLEIYKRLLQYSRRYWLAFVLGVVGTLLSSFVEASFTWGIKPTLDKGIIAHDPYFVRWLPIWIVSAFLLRGIFNFIATYCMTWVARNVVMTLRQEMFTHLLKLPARFYDKSTSGQLLSAIIYNVDQVAKASTDALVTLVQQTGLIIGLLAVMLTTSWQLSLLFFTVAPFITYIAKYSSKRMRKLSTNVQGSMGEITHVAEEAIEGYKVIRTFGGQEYEQDKFNRLTAKNRFRELKITITNTLASSTVQIIGSVVIAVTVYIATLKQASITAGAFTATIVAMAALIKPMRDITTVNSVIQRGIAAAESIFNLIDTPPERDTGVIALKRVEGAIKFDEVSFSYYPDRPVLKQVSFVAEPGQTIALVGRSGSGKSTLVHLLPRFYDGYTGKISIDDIDIEQIKLADLRNQFAFVSQHVTLFNDTIAHNVAYGRLSEIGEKEIVAALEAAHAWEFVRELPAGINTRVGENGVLLSGGQRQRLAIARALLKDAPILILDEATSALDTEAERHIQAALEQLMRNRTTLVIAHRLSTVENANKILVLDGGQIVESGTHADLIALDGYYAKLYRMQFRED